MNTSIDAANVFLISGQEVVTKVGNRRGLSAEPIQRVVVADNAEHAMLKLATKEPDFKALGIASLQDYESTARRLREVVAGIRTDWVLYVE